MTLKMKREYSGLKFTELSEIQPDVHASFTWSRTEKAYLHGKLSYDLHEGSYQYPDEVVTTVWTNEPPDINVLRAYNHGFYRIEIPVEAAH